MSSNDESKLYPNQLRKQLAKHWAKPLSLGLPKVQAAYLTQPIMKGGDKDE